MEILFTDTLINVSACRRIADFKSPSMSGQSTFMQAIRRKRRIGVNGGNKMDAKFVRERITELRMLKDMSEYQLSLELGRSHSYIQSITSGKTSPSMSVFFDICNYFKISPQEFFDKDIHNPDRIHGIVDQLKLLSDDDLAFFEETLRRYLGKK